MERRESYRSRKVFMPAYLEASGRRHLVMLRDLSDLGAGFEGDVDLAPGERVCVAWGSGRLTQAIVKWCERGRFGLQLENAAHEPTPSYPYRSVRIPVEADATVFLQGCRHDAILVNISQGGTALKLQAPCTKGDLATITCGGFSTTNATLKWMRGGLVGFRFQNSIPIDAISQVIDIQQDAAALAA